MGESTAPHTESQLTEARLNMSPERGEAPVNNYKQIEFESGTYPPKTCGQVITNPAVPAPFGNDSDTNDPNSHLSQRSAISSRKACVLVA